MHGESHGGRSAPSRRMKHPAPSHDEIAREAYLLWERHGRPSGRDAEFWQEAERTLRDQCSHDGVAKPRTILLVDDEPLCRHFMSLFLRYEGYVVIEAGSGEEARRFLEAGCQTDILVTDYQMPGINGEELASWLHQNHPNIPALLVSGLPDIRDRVRLEHPRFHCMPKPCDPHELTEAVSSLLTTPHPEVDAYIAN